MVKLYHCEACGFMSTIKDSFMRNHGLYVCCDCIYDYENKISPAYEWVKIFMERITR